MTSKSDNNKDKNTTAEKISKIDFWTMLILLLYYNWQNIIAYIFFQGILHRKVVKFVIPEMQNKVNGTLILYFILFILFIRVYLCDRNHSDIYVHENDILKDNFIVKSMKLLQYISLIGITIYIVFILRKFYTYSPGLIIMIIIAIIISIMWETIKFYYNYMKVYNREGWFDYEVLLMAYENSIPLIVFIIIFIISTLFVFTKFGTNLLYIVILGIFSLLLLYLIDPDTNKDINNLLCISSKTLYNVNNQSPDYYEILGLNKNADNATIKKKCRELKLKLHPDKGGSVDEFNKINEACEYFFEKPAQRPRNNI